MSEIVEAVSTQKSLTVVKKKKQLLDKALVKAGKIKKPAKQKKYWGRNSRWNEETRRLTLELYKRGMTDADVCAVLNISTYTIHNWKKKNPDYFQEVQDWREKADREIEKCLRDRAKGWIGKEDKIVMVYDREQKQSVPKVITINKYYPPDTTAAIFWLKNRHPDRWQDRQQVDANLHIQVSRKHYKEVE